MDMSYFCANCMEKISTYQDTCPHCGFCNTDYTPPSHALVPMTVLQGRYLIGRVLGAGGFGITYVARDLKVDKKVCIKEFFVRGSMYREGSTSEMVSLITDGNVSERLYYANLEKFEQEAKILGRFDNVPGIVGVSDYFHENNTAYIVMEYLEGITLKAYVQSNGGRITWEDLSDRLRPVFSSLQALHDQGVYHRDLSPDNIMLLRDGSLKVFDFGGARIDTDGHGASSMIIRKIGYSPIEQYSRGKQGPWTDVYAMAATLYYCLAGKAPADSTDRAGEIDSLEKFESLNIKVPKNVEKAIYKGLAVKPDDRYRSMADFEQALYSGKGTTSRHTSSSFSYDRNEEKGKSSPTEKEVHRSGHKGLVVLLIIAACLVAGAAAFFYFSGKDETATEKSNGSDIEILSTEYRTEKKESTEKKEEKKETEKKAETKTVETEKSKTKEEFTLTEAPKAKEEIIETEAPETEEKVTETEAPETEEKATETEAPETEEKVTETEAPETEEKATETEAPETEKKAVETEAPETEEKVTETKVPETEEKVTESEIPDTEKSEIEIVETRISETEEIVVETEIPETEVPETEAITPGDESYKGSFQIFSTDGLTLYKDSGNYDLPETELRHVDEADTYVIGEGDILYIDTVCQFRDKLWGHTNYYGLQGWVAMDAGSLGIISRNDVTAQSGSIMYLSSQSPSVTLRSNPDALSTGMVVPDNGQQCVLVQCYDGWGQVTVDDYSGWIEMSDLSFYATDMIYRMNMAENAELLTSPQTQEEGAFVLATVPAGSASVLYVDAVNNGYGKTSYDGKTGWILMSSLELIGDSTIVMNADQCEKPAEYANRVWRMNQLVEEHAAISHVEDEHATRLDESEIYETVFGIPDWNRYSITGIYVIDTLDVEGKPEGILDLASARQNGAANNAVDLSAAGDGGVVGWINENGALIIAGDGGVKAPTDCSSLFARFTGATVIDLGGNLHTDDTTDFRYLFYSCTEAQTINVSGLITSGATSFDKMFTGCHCVESLDLSSFDSSRVESFYYMFQNCTTLRDLDMTSFSTDSAWQYSGMFRGCENVIQIRFDTARFNTAAARRMESMFQDCASLQRANVEHFNMSHVESTNNMFNGCRNLLYMELYWDLSSCPRDEHSNSYGMFEDCPLQTVYGKDGEVLFGDPIYVES